VGVSGNNGLNAREEFRRAVRTSAVKKNWRKRFSVQKHLWVKPGWLCGLNRIQNPDGGSSLYRLKKGDFLS